jgi:hypothetical protein
MTDNNNNGIYDCGKDKVETACADSEKSTPLQYCKNIEESFTDVWTRASTSEQDAIENIWSAVRDKKDSDDISVVPSKLNKKLHAICSERQGATPSMTSPKVVSDCDSAASYIRAFTKYDDYADTIFGKGLSDECTDANICGFWNMHTGQKDCRFRDQDYGYGYKGEEDKYNSTAEELCEKEKVQENKINNQLKVGKFTFIDTSPQFYDKALDKLGAESVNEIINNISISLEPKTVVSQSNDCSNLFSGRLSNTISAKCDLLSDPEALNTLLSNNDIVMTPDLLAELTQMKISNIFQGNVVEAVQNCQMSNTMDGLLKMDATIDNKAFQSAISEAKGFGGNAKSKNSSCSDIDVNMSPCVYVEQSNCCANKIEIASDNTIQAGCNSIIDNIIQDNKINQLQSCNTIADTTLTTQLAAEVFNTTTQTAESTSGINYVLVLAMILITFIACLYIFVRYMKRFAAIGLVLGIISIIAGIGFTYLFFVNRIVSGTVYQKPYSTCSECKTDLSKKMSWGDAKDLFEASDAYLALDFFPDENETGGRTIIEPLDDDDDDVGAVLEDSSVTYVDYNRLPDDWSGLAVFISKPNRDGECLPLCSESIESDERCKPENKIYSITQNKDLQDIAMIGSGLGFLFAGLILIIVYIVMVTTIPEENVTNISYDDDIFNGPPRWSRSNAHARSRTNARSRSNARVRSRTNVRSRSNQERPYKDRSLLDDTKYRSNRSERSNRSDRLERSNRSELPERSDRRSYDDRSLLDDTKYRSNRSDRPSNNRSRSLIR